MSANIRPSGVFDISYQQDIALNRTRNDKLLAWIGFGALLIIPLLTRLGPFRTDILPLGSIGTIERIAIIMIAVQGLNLLIGYTGQVSLGQAAFVAVGAYANTILLRAGLPFWLSLPLAALVTGLVGLVFGLPSLRVKGFYLAMATVAAQFIIPWLLRNPLEPLTNGARPLEVPRLSVFGAQLDELALYYVFIPISFCAMLAARNIIRSRSGRAFISIRDNDLAAELLGINVFAYKLRAFFLCALYAGLAGGLLSVEAGSLSADRFDLNSSIEMLAMLVIGGAGFPQGALFGVSFVLGLREMAIPAVTPFLTTVLPQLLPFIDSVNINSALTPVLFGTAIILFLILEPRGLAYRWEIIKISLKLRPFSH